MKSNEKVPEIVRYPREVGVRNSNRRKKFRRIMVSLGMEMTFAENLIFDRLRYNHLPQESSVSEPSPNAGDWKTSQFPSSPVDYMMLPRIYAII